MSGKKRATSKKTRRPESSHQELAQDFLARLDHSWQQHGREILDRVLAERPELYFQALVRLTVVLHRRLPEPPDFNRCHYRADVLRRLQQRAENARSGETIDGPLVAASTLVSLLVIEVWTRKCGRLTLPRAPSTLQNCRIERNVDASAKHLKEFSFLRPHLASTLQPPIGSPKCGGTCGR
jgi:hypothetical protein